MFFFTLPTNEKGTCVSPFFFQGEKKFKKKISLNQKKKKRNGAAPANSFSYKKELPYPLIGRLFFSKLVNKDASEPWRALLFSKKSFCLGYIDFRKIKFCTKSVLIQKIFSFSIKDNIAEDW